MSSANFLRVSDTDIGRLNDAQLKRLVALLGRADLVSAGLGVSGLWGGGHQNAPDGGSDVRISWTGGPPSLDCAPRRRTEVQCKATSMPAGAVTEEMRPKGLLRPLITQLITEGGAYIIASTESCAEGMLEARLDAMRAALAAEANPENLALDFYDAGRLAEFANRHAGVTLWVKEAIGESSLGWRHWGSWSAAGRSGDLSFIHDETPRAILPGEKEPIAIGEVITRLRAHLRQPRAVARVVGLSGLGKTRLAEALFDERVGATPLSAEQAVYGDIAASPTVSPTEAADRIARSGQHVIVIADNCPHDTHRRMAELLLAGDGQASLLTIDFDVDDDRPASTLVIELAENGDALIDTLLKNRAPLIGQVDRQCIVKFSGGNARIALALANTAADGEGLANLSETELLDRLFLNTRRQNDPAMARCAEAAALVYSFNIEAAADTPEGEIGVIAGWAGVSSDEVYRQMAELMDRGLAQKRGRWRAVLPHALAAKLARRGFARVPPATLLKSLEGRPRLFASFCKRLGHLHDVADAVEMAEKLMAEGAPLGDPCALTGNDLDAFIELAPASPGVALTSLERSMADKSGEAVLSRAHPEHYRYARFLRSLAYEPEHFARALGQLVVMTARERPNENTNPTSDEVNELYQLHLSGTLAPPSLRLERLDAMFNDPSARVRAIALHALDSMLTADSWTSSALFSFGARNRTYGWEPANHDDVAAWYAGAVERVVRLTESRDPLADAALQHLAHSIEPLGRAGFTGMIVLAAKRIRAVRFWPEGWRSVREALANHRSEMPTEIVEKLEALEQALRPTTLEDRFAAYVLSEYWREVDPSGADGDDDRKPYDRPAEIAKELGSEIAALDETRVREFVTQATAAKKGYARAFGAGLYQPASDQGARWVLLKEIFASSPTDAREINVIGGFVYAASQDDIETAHAWLDEIEGDELYAPYMVHLTAVVAVDARGLGRLKRLVDLPAVPRWTFKNLMLGRVMENTLPSDLVALLRALDATGADGHEAVIDVLAMRFAGEGEAHASELLAYAREIVVALHQASDPDTMRDHHLGILTAACLKVGDEDLARKVCKKVDTLVDDRKADRKNWEGVMKVVIRHHPRVVLDELLDKDPPRHSSRLDSWLTAYQSGDDYRREAPIDQVPTDVFMAWVSQAPKRRAAIAAQLGRAVIDKGGAPAWSELAVALLAMPQADAELARSLMRRFWTMHWSNLAGLVKRRPLIEQLAQHANGAIRAAAPALLAEFDIWVAEGERGARREDESFE